MSSYQDVILDLSILSEQELDFYNFTIQNYHFLINSNLKAVSCRYGVGMSFIYAFFKKIKVSGLRDYVYKLGILKGISLANISDYNKDNNILEKIQDNYQVSNYINALMFDDQQKKINCLLDEINRAKKIYAFGMGHSLIALNDLCGMLTHFGYSTSILEKGKNIVTSKILKITKDDLLIVFSMRGLHAFTQKLLALLKREKIKAKIILITSNPQSTLLKYSDLTIYIDNQVRRINDIESNLIFSPLWSFLFFTDYLKNLLYEKNKEKIDQCDSFSNEMESWHNNKLLQKQKRME
ncbi:SIS domain-containing protein [Spiroplasma sp. SV19]|uniref:MurR/RpiR family transcriptional regulator n=1 Tax=Spiroplasma sp. SV19 TaxID=2570468 RepID=UPI0024B6D94F|nr:SIS domain-containing protein [Spiroplasma sp. SV19]WHQ37241.1 SIS domain-containing protein [Spiroplasma sp. SV19]